VFIVVYTFLLSKVLLIYIQQCIFAVVYTLLEAKTTPQKPQPEVMHPGKGEHPGSGKMGYAETPGRAFLT